MHRTFRSFFAFIAAGLLGCTGTPSPPPPADTAAADTPAWLSTTRPEAVVLSLAADNIYGHPHAAALRYYCAGGRRVYRTDVHGDVRVLARASGEFEVRTEREGSGGCDQGG